jgi:hypothetical protein
MENENVLFNANKNRGAEAPLLYIKKFFLTISPQRVLESNLSWLLLGKD